MQELSLFSTPFTTLIVCRLFDDGHSDQCEVISHYSFDLLQNEWCWASFHVCLSHLYIFFGEMSIQVFCPFLIRLFSWYWAIWALCKIWRLTPCQSHHSQISPILWAYFMVSFAVQKLLIMPCLVLLVFPSLYIVVIYVKECAAYVFL